MMIQIKSTTIIVITASIPTTIEIIMISLALLFSSSSSTVFGSASPKSEEIESSSVTSG